LGYEGKGKSEGVTNKVEKPEEGDKYHNNNNNNNVSTYKA